MKPNNLKNISIIIPVLNEEDHIGLLLHYLKRYYSPTTVKEILIVDGGSKDDTIKIAREFGIRVIPSEKGRAKQMNLGAIHAQGDVFYFLHVDTFPPKKFDYFVLDAINKGYEAGCFRIKFDNNSWFLQFFSWFSRINHKICRGGDQSLFITKSLFQKTGGFNEDYRVYEDNEFIGRLYKKTSFKILPQHVRTSARKYEEKGMVKLQYHFGVIHIKNYLGAEPDKLYQYYKRNIPL